MERYETYKDSGIEWIGEIPARWEVKKLKYILSISNGEGIKSEEIKDFGDYPVYGGNGLVGYTTEFNNDDDVFVIGRVGAKCGNIRFISGKKWISDNALLAYASGNSKYIEFFMTALDLNKLANKNAQPLITSSMIKEQYIFLPPQDEQTAIANYLDRKTAEIDALITQKQRLIELYQEEKTGIINQAVTQGIDPGAKLKDSGIDWLGEIPEGWEVRKLGHLYRVVRGGSPRPAGSPLYFNGTHTPWITVGELTKDKSKFLTETKEFLTEEGRKQSRVIKPNTLLLSNSGATLGVPKITLIEGCINDGSVAFLNSPLNVDDSFIYYYLSGLTYHLRMLVQVSGQPNLNTDLVKGLCVGLPSKVEQTAIVHHIETEAARIDTKIAKTQRIIELQKEYRTALISEVVTGKIKVSHLTGKEITS